MAQVKNEEEKKKETTKKNVKKTTMDEKATSTKKKPTSKVSAEETAKKRTVTTSKRTKAVKESENVDKKGTKTNEKTEKVEDNKKETKIKSTKKVSDTKKKSTITKTGNGTTKKATKVKVPKNAKTKGKITKITASKKPEEIVEESDDVVITDAKDHSKDVVKFEDEQKMQLVEDELKKDLKSKTKLPKEEEKKLSTVVFENLCVAIAFMIYLFFIILGFINIKEEVYVVDLKVFSFILLVIAILLFERAYKKDSGRLCAFGIETLFLSIATMGLLYANIEINNIFLPVAATISLLFAIYYVAKSIYLYSKMKKKYFVDNMKDIMQKEEKE